jgi:hypothetical protein
MTHRNMSHLSAADLNFEVAQSKKCSSDHDENYLSSYTHCQTLLKIIEVCWSANKLAQ